MTGEQEQSPEWMEEFRKANLSSYPLTPPPRPAAGTERRRHPRFEIDLAPASLRLRRLTFLPFLRPALPREAVDLSEGGARILAAERLPPGTRLHLRIEIQKFQDAILGDAEVRWCRQIPGQQPRFHLGIMFTREDLERARKIAAMRGYFTSPNYLAARQKRQREKNGLLSSG